MNATINTVCVHDTHEVRIVKNPMTQKYYVEYLDTDGYSNTVKIRFDDLKAAQQYVDTTLIPSAVVRILW